MEEDNCSEDIKSTIHANSNPFKEDPMKLQPKIHVDKTFFACIDYPEIFEYSKFLELHRTTHEPIGKKRRKCPQCRSTFQIMSEYAEHIQSHLTSSHRCSFCPKIFLSYAPFKKHIADHKKNRDLVCSYCGKSFSIKRSLDVHIRIHTNERPYKCDDCGKTFIQLSTLGSHKKLVHKLGELLDCPKCSNQFSTRSSLTRHIKKIHDSGKFQTCTECKKEFTTKELLEKHRIERHSSLSAFYEVCQVCKEEFFTRAQYIDHHHGDGDYLKERHSKLSEDDDKPVRDKLLEKHHHGDGDYPEGRYSKLSEEDDKPTTDILESHKQQANSPKTKKVTCWLCGEKVISSDYPNHKRDHMMLTAKELVVLRRKGIYPCKKCDKLYATRKGLFEHMDCHMTKQYKCSNTCNEKSLFTYVGLKNHLCSAGYCQLPSEANEDTKNNIGCKWCPMSFKNTRSLLMHYREHIDSTGYQCNECSKRFSKPIAVKAHIRLTHGKVFGLQYCYEQLAFKQQKTCRWCKVSFVTKKALDCHENLHKSNKHQCKECKISFPRFVIYLSHIRNMKCKKWTIEALIPEVKQLKCIFCKKIFGNCILVTAHVLARHMRELYPCKFCGSSVALQSLRAHLIENHNSEHKYSCLGCDASFVTLKAYVEHRNFYARRPFSHKDAVQSASVPIDSDMMNGVLVKAEDDIVDIPDTVWVNDEGELRTYPSEVVC